MNEHNDSHAKLRAPLYGNFVSTVELLGTFLSVGDKTVPLFIRNQAFMRRLSLSFIALFEYLRAASELPQEYLDKQPDDLASYFVEKGFLGEDDKESFTLLANIYVAIRWSSPGKSPDEEKIIMKAQSIYEFLKKIVDRGLSVR
jgi:hypothetical protein